MSWGVLQAQYLLQYNFFQKSSSHQKDMVMNKPKKFDDLTEEEFRAIQATNKRHVKLHPSDCTSHSDEIEDKGTTSQKQDDETPLSTNSEES